MNLAEELKHLITIRDLFSGQLTNGNLDEETKQQLNLVVGATTDRIYLILDTLISEEAALKDVNTKQLSETKSSWFNELAKTILRLLAAREIAERIDVEKIVTIIRSF